MPFRRPTRTTLISQAKADMATQLGLDALLRFQPETAMAVALAGMTDGLYGYLDWIARQAVPFTATGEFLEAWAALKGITREAATKASGTATFTGTSGTVLPSGTAVVRGDGVRYLTTATGTVGGGGSVTVAIEAETAGTDGNADSGTQLSLASAVTGINATGSAATEIAGGAAAETDAALRTRMLERYAAPPQGGAKTDYVAWAKEVAGITRAWAKPNGMGAGTVVVYIMLDDVRAADGGLPTGTDGVATDETRDTVATGDQLLVADHIYPLRPATALVYVAAPVAYPVAITINDLNDAALQDAIEASLQDMLRERAELEGTLYPSDFVAAIEAVSGVTQFSMPTPSAPVTAPAGKIHTLGTITWG